MGSSRLACLIRRLDSVGRLYNLAMMDPSSLFGQVDIYLFDQLLRGRIRPGMSILDAGCGQGRNLVFFLRQGYEVCAVDPELDAIRAVRRSTSGSPRSFLSRTSGRKRSSRTAFRIAPQTWSSAAPFSTSPETSPTSGRCFAAPGASSSPTACSFAASHRPSAWKAVLRPWAGDDSLCPTAPSDSSSTNRIFSSSSGLAALWPIPEDDSGSGSPVHDDLGAQKGRRKHRIVRYSYE